MIKVGPALMEHADQLERERGIPRDVVLSSLQEAMVAAYKRYAKLSDTTGIICKLLEKSGEIGIFEVKSVVADNFQPPVTEEEDPELGEEAETEDGEPAFNPNLIIRLSDARKIKADVEIGETLEIEVTPQEFGRIAAQSAKQVIMQRIREAEKMLIQREFEEKRGTVVTGIIQRVEGRNVIVNIGKSEALLPPREQLPGEYYRVGNKVRAYIMDLRDSGRVPQIIISQGHPSLVREVFELEVPEIEDGLVQVKNIAREAGFRTKVAVHSTDPDVDPQGACIGNRGSRIQAIVNELRNEKIDIIRWSENPVEFITNALAPARIVRVMLDPNPSTPPRALVVVPDDQLSLAIGREGQNVRLAAKLTGYKLDIKSTTQMQHDPVVFAPAPVPQTEAPSADAAADADDAESFDETLDETLQEAEAGVYEGDIQPEPPSDSELEIATAAEEQPLEDALEATPYDEQDPSEAESEVEPDDETLDPADPVDEPLNA
ncbi:MAG: transcription termination factor NusA [Candidatus Melainabacteria bacterium]|nr:transcription termination factor NusA [Candidatus Melainabacteria bacterium]